MDDLKDLSWQAAAASKPGISQGQTGTGPVNVNYNPIFQRQNNPFSQQTNAASKPLSNPMANSSSVSSANGDSFGDLVSFGTKKSEKMTMAQQAVALQAQKAKELEKSHKNFNDSAFFEQQMSRPSSAAPASLPRSQTNLYFVPDRLRKSETETSEDILAQINGGGPVDRSSYYPPPASPTKMTLASPIGRPEPRTATHSSSIDDDVFGVFENMRSNAGNKSPSALPKSMSPQDDLEFDILGDLAKPVQPNTNTKVEISDYRSNSIDQEVHTRPFVRDSSSSSDDSDDDDLRRAKAESRRQHTQQNADASDRHLDNPRAPYIEQLVEMGFTEKQASAALAQTESGTDVAQAAELLLSLQIGPRATSKRQSPQRTQNDTRATTQIPASQKQMAESSGQSGDWVDSTYDIASKTLASANSWFTNKSAMARRKLAEYNASQAAATYDSRFDERPKWLRDAEKYERKEKGKARAKEEEDEALREEGLPMHPAERKRLEMNGVLPPISHARRGSIDSSKSAKSITGSILSIPDSLRSIGANISGHHNAKLPVPAHKSDDFRQFKANDDEAANFVSSRRRKPPAALQSSTSTSPYAENSRAASRGESSGTRQALDLQEEDLFGEPSPRHDKGKGKAKATIPDDVDAIQGNRRLNKGKGKAIETDEVDLFSPPCGEGHSAVSSTTAPRTMLQRKSQASRVVPYTDATILAASSQNRTKGSDAFKRGDFAKALVFYDNSLSGLPDAHPLRVLCLTNRAITQIQIGASKPAITDCDEALKIIGPMKGANETIEDSGKKILMTALYCKAMTRKATALEMLEKVNEALKVWQELVRSGLGGPQAMESRQRCETLAMPKKKPMTPKPPTASSQQPSQASRAAVQKLRVENDKAAQAESQRDALYESVDASIAAWSAGKEQNIRALLSSLDQVLWPTSGWKKVTLADLVINSKVKVIYMKALAKVHPDKIARDASVEEKMIAASVFSKLNGAWDAFKSTNNM